MLSDFGLHPFGYLRAKLSLLRVSLHFLGMRWYDICSGVAIQQNTLGKGEGVT